jgi:hypothetical protein
MKLTRNESVILPGVEEEAWQDKVTHCIVPCKYTYTAMYKCHSSSFGSGYVHNPNVLPGAADSCSTFYPS